MTSVERAIGNPPDDSELPEPEPSAAVDVFGDRIELARRYHQLLAGSAVVRGLIGPREVPRLWSRHIMNCAVVEELIPAESHVVDVGSGAGLPGLVLAIARPDLHMTLVDSLQRRTTWLTEAVTDLGLDAQVTVHRGRAEEMRSTYFDVSTSRAVAPLTKLAGWCLPLLGPEGVMLAIKGSTADEELAEAEPALRKLDARSSCVVEVGGALLDEPTRVVRIQVSGAVRGPAARSDSGSRSRSGRRDRRRTR